VFCFEQQETSQSHTHRQVLGGGALVHFSYFLNNGKWEREQPIHIRPTSNMFDNQSHLWKLSYCVLHKKYDKWPDFFGGLPHELLDHISGWLNFQDKTSLAMTCWTWMSFLRDDLCEQYQRICENGDSLPYPTVTLEELDEELDLDEGERFLTRCVDFFEETRYGYASFYPPSYCAGEWS
jgi:hypothetical protein